MNDSTPPRYYLPVSLLIMLAGFTLRVWSISTTSLWIDEIWTVWYVKAPVGRFFDLLLADGAQVPLYYIIQYLFPSNNDLMLRLPSLLFGLAGIALIIGLVYDLYRDSTLALAAGTLLATNPYHIWFSWMARPYALVFVEALLVSYFFLKLLRGQRTTSIWLGLLLVSMAAYLTHFFALALPLAEYILMGFAPRKDRRFFWRWFLLQIAALLPLFYWMFKRVTNSELGIGTTWIPEPALIDLPLALINMSIGYDHTVLWYFVPALIALGAGMLPGVVLAIRDRADLIDFFWLWLIAAVFLPSLAVSALYPVFVDRYLMVSLPAVLLLMLRGWSALPRRFWQIAPVGIVALTGLVHVAHKIGSGDYTRQDWRAAAHYIDQRYQPGDAFTEETPLSLLCIEHYYPDDDVIRNNQVKILDRNSAEIPASRLWIVYRNPNVDIHRQGKMPEFDPYTPGLTAIGDWLIAHRDQVIDLREFNGVTVLLVDMR
jgi:uncharacterized membrane protein